MEKAKRIYRRTISPDLLTQWHELTRKNDARELANILPFSQPTIVKALTYGHANQQLLIDGINTFFALRLHREAQQAIALIQLRAETDVAVIRAETEIPERIPLTEQAQRIYERDTGGRFAAKLPDCSRCSQPHAAHTDHKCPDGEGYYLINLNQNKSV